MSEPTPRPQQHNLGGGDRIRIRQGRQRLISNLVGQLGTVVEVFRMPLDSCLVRIDSDANHQREWFFYRDEVTPIEA